ncbi:Ger(x)C family spore germination protein [Bacillus alkalicellulosilyticus]|uniref:Ger(x)C family spore germination protein n=1 Tax=Alkalihalobacterium alkalicellulosilyticum TaxID=1912214 RepID=UPI0009970D85|nr:Ger(x)C family spore germination protein [Bacillus alkalicellulosilyticus]
MKQKIKKMTTSLVVLLILTSCSPDARELDERSMILGLAIDRGEEKLYKVSIQLPILAEEPNSGAEQASREFEVFSVESDALWEAFAELESYTPSVLFFGHLKVVAISEELARNGLGDVIDTLDREATVANQVSLIIVEGKAEEFIRTESPLINLPALYLHRFFQADQKISRAERIKLFEFLRDTNMISNAATLPLGRINDESIVIEGLGVFKDYSMVGKLRMVQAGVSQLLKNNEVDDMNITVVVDHVGKKVTSSITRMHLKQKVRFDKESPITFTLDVRGEGQLIALSDVTARETPEFLESLETTVEEEVKKEIEAAIEEMKKINIEPWLLGHRVWATNPRLFEKLDWETTGWKNANFEITVDFEINDTGQRGYYNKKKIGR